MSIENSETVETGAAPLGAPVEDPSPLTEDGELQQLRVERDELRELLQRRQAEFENFRKRTDRDRAEYGQYASMDVVRELVSVLDDFERAVKAECASPEYARGVELIYNRMVDALRKVGLEPMESVGKPFDPHLHQAVERVDTQEAEDNTVLGEFQRGYNFKGRLLRPAMVRVAVRS